MYGGSGVGNAYYTDFVFYITNGNLTSNKTSLIGGDYKKTEPGDKTYSGIPVISLSSFSLIKT